MNYVRWDRFLEPQIVIFSIFALFYVFVLFRLITSKQKLLRGSYFVIFIYTGPELDAVYIVAATLTGVLYSLHVLGNFLATVCQYMAVCWPGSYEKLWNTQLTLFYLLLATIIATVPQLPGVAMINVYKQRNDTSYGMYTDEIDSAGFIFSAVIVLVYICIAPVLVLKTFVSLKYLAVESKPLKRHYQSLAIITLVDCLFFLIDLVYEMDLLIWFVFETAIYPDWLEELLGDPFDVYYSIVYISNPLILLLFSRVARREVVRNFGKEKMAAKTISVVPQPHSAIRKTSKISTASTLF